MSDDRKGFTVNDRRQFTAEGELRLPLPEEGARVEAEPDEAPTPAEPAVASAMPGPSRPRSPNLGGRVTLSDLLVQLAGNASLLLGLGAPEGEEPAIDLEAARDVIGILEMLREKTEGRRTPEEDKLIDGILYELHMSYVALARAGGA
jgi:hypothetical protein